MGGYETLPTVPCDIWIAGFVMQYEHLYHLCGAHGLTKEEIDRQQPLPAARRIMKGWRGGVDLIEVRTISGDGSRHIDFLLVLLVSPQLRGEKAPLHLLGYDPKYAEILPTIFPPEYVSSDERLFPQGRLPWVRMPWPLYLYGASCRLVEMHPLTIRQLHPAFCASWTGSPPMNVRAPAGWRWTPRPVKLPPVLPMEACLRWTSSLPRCRRNLVRHLGHRRKGDRKTRG